MTTHAIYIGTHEKSVPVAEWILNHNYDKSPLLVKIIPDPKDARSLEQNSMFHALMQNVSKRYHEHYGEKYSPEVWKEYFKAMFLGQETIEIKGELVTMTRKTRKLNTEQMSDLIDNVIHYCGAEFEIDISRQELSRD